MSFTIGGFYDADEGEVRYGIEIPNLLSLLAFHDPNATVTGLDSVAPRGPPAGQHRPLRVPDDGRDRDAARRDLRRCYLLTWFRKRRLPRSPWFYRAVIAAGPLALVALICGWVTTEVGRQPWIVYETMRTTDAVTASDGLEVGFVVLVAVYVALGAAFAWLMRRLTSRPEQELVQR